MKVLIIGGTGQIGQLLSHSFISEGHDVTVTSRNPQQSAGRVELWDGKSSQLLQPLVDKTDVLINMAGRSVNCRYTPQNRADILSSRIESTRAIAAAIASSTTPPTVWLQASTATIYAHRYDAPNDEATGIIGGSEPYVPETWKFSIDVARAWESAALERPLVATRTVLLRSAMTMSTDPGGVFDVMAGLVKRGLGGTQGDGNQYVSWIHGHDFVRAINYLIDHPIDGAVNLSSPYPLPNRDFMRILRTALGRSVGLPTSRWMLEIGARLLGTETELVLKSRRVVPTRLLEAGFEFLYPEWAEAVRNLTV